MLVNTKNINNKICFIQPNSNYGVPENKYALSLTFPTLISIMNLKSNDYEIYIDGINERNLDYFLTANEIGFVFITSITCNFPRALELASICKKVGCITILGGIFATMNYNKIVKNFNQFDIIVTGKPTSSLMVEIRKICGYPTVVHCGNTHPKTDNIAEIINNEKFMKSYINCKVCYEIISGCNHNCSFCTLKNTWNQDAFVTKTKKQIIDDISYLSKRWKALKIIDEDVLQNPDILENCSFNHLFDEIIAETRVDRINEANISRLKNFGISHLVFGVESFHNNFLLSTNKTFMDNWESVTHNALELCNKYSIIARPILMLTAHGHDLKYLDKLKTKIATWNSHKNVDVLFSFYTPHPGLKGNLSNGILLTNNLSLFDHLHLVFLPNDISIRSINEVIIMYNELVEITNSFKFNPPISLNYEMNPKYFCFFSQ